METVKEAQKRLAKRGRRLQILYIVHAELYAVAVILGLLRWPLPAAALAAANLLAYIAYLRRENMAFGTAVVEANVLHGVCAPLQSPSATGSDGPAPEELADWELFPLRVDKKSVLLRYGFAGRWSGLEVRGWELAFHYPVWQSDGKAQYQFLSGTLLTARLPSAPDARDGWLLLRKGLLDHAAQGYFIESHGYQPVPCPSEALAKEFGVWSKTAEAELPQELARGLEQLLRHAPGLGAVRLTSGAAMLYLDKSFYTLRMKLRFLPDEAWLRRNLLAERDGALSFLRTWERAVKRMAHG